MPNDPKALAEQIRQILDRRGLRFLVSFISSTSGGDDFSVTIGSDGGDQPPWDELRLLVPEIEMLDGVQSVFVDLGVSQRDRDR